MFRILVEPYIYDAFYELLLPHKQPEFELIRVDFTEPESQWLSQLTKADVILGGVSLEASHYEQAPQLKLIQTIRAGYDGIDLQRAKRFGVAVANNGSANAVAVAEHVFLLVLSLYRQLDFHHRVMTEGRWENRKDSNLEMAGKTLGIVGLGHIGKALARRAAAFEMRVLYYDIQRPSKDFEEQHGLQYLSFEELLRQSDILSFHVPLTSKTQHMINTHTLQQMKSTAILINTSRGAVQDEAALIEALQSQQIAGAGLDVFEQEPLAANSPLRQMPNVILTPHSAPSKESRVHAITNAMQNIQHLFTNQDLQFLVVDYEASSACLAS